MKDCREVTSSWQDNKTLDPRGHSRIQGLSQSKRLKVTFNLTSARTTPQSHHIVFRVTLICSACQPHHLAPQQSRYTNYLLVRKKEQQQNWPQVTRRQREMWYWPVRKIEWLTLTQQTSPVPAW
ncbi:hypothetical protein PoB_003995900 [Plakobranchus ocellatus]|uniref:Uncharacterized protein n=1 Tax=Plakobranchus ocellatus TaxID=259542 RepID=A0AAV4B502_9GAST|nr:hypothetical protein PoB_003995900 [Plakobranchus ocellatus]